MVSVISASNKVRRGVRDPGFSDFSSDPTVESLISAFKMVVLRSPAPHPISLVLSISPLLTEGPSSMQEDTTREGDNVSLRHRRARFLLSSTSKKQTRKKRFRHYFCQHLWMFVSSLKKLCTASPSTRLHVVGDTRSSLLPLSDLPTLS